MLCVDAIIYDRCCFVKDFVLGVVLGNSMKSKIITLILIAFLFVNFLTTHDNSVYDWDTDRNLMRRLFCTFVGHLWGHQIQ